MASAAATLAVAGAALRLANPCGISGEASGADGAPLTPRKLLSSQETPRWREMDSNHRSLRLFSAQVPAGMTAACDEIWQVKFVSCWINGVGRR